MSLALLTTQSAGQAAEDPVARVQEWLDSWTRLSGRFEQTLSSPTLPSTQVEAGRFQVARPGRMRWDFREPERKLAVSDGVHTWLYVPADRQVVRGRLEDLRDGAISLLLGGTQRLTEAFLVVRASAGDGEIRLTLHPRRDSPFISEVDLQAEERSGAVRALSVTDASGNLVAYQFWDIVLDPDLDEKLFHFQVPPGVEVQDLKRDPEDRSSP